MTLLKDRPSRKMTTPRTGRRRSATAGRLVALLLLIAACWGALLAITPSPSENPVLRSTSPGNEEVVKSPDNVLLTFDRPIPAGLVTVRIISSLGDQIVFDRPVHPDNRADTISVPMPPARYEGTYSVAWTMPSSQLEPVGGTFEFMVNAPNPMGTPEIETTHDPVVTAFYTTARIASIAAMALLIGAVFFVAVVWPGAARSKSVRRLVTYSWLGLVVATLGVLVSFGPYAAWVPLSDAFDPALLSATLESDAGGALLARLLVLVPATLGVAQLLTSTPADSRRERWLRGGTVLGCAAALAASWTFAGPRPPGAVTPLALIVDIVLLTAIAIPISGLVMLWLLLPHIGRLALGNMIPLFSRIVLWCGAALVLTGTYQAWRHVGSFASLTTSYGWLLVGMLALLVLFIAIAAVCRSWVYRRYAAPPPAAAVEDNVKRTKKRGASQQERIDFRRLVAGATGVAALIVGGTAALIVIQPPQTAHAQGTVVPPPAVREQAPPMRVAFDTGTPGGRGWVDLVAIPVAGGQHQVHLDAHISVLGENGAARDDMTVTAVLNRPDNSAQPVPVPLSHAAPGYAVGSGTMSTPGRWGLALTVQAGDGSKQTLTQPIDVQ
jgi:copper transport protein